MMDLFATPWVFLLTCTVPVYESDLIASEHGHRDSLASRAPSAVEPTQHASQELAKEPCPLPRFLLFVHCWFVPPTIAAFWGALSRQHWAWSLPLMLFISLLMSVFVLRTTEPGKPAPSGYKAISFVGFAVAVLWISQIATEVVAILKAVGIIFNLSEAILGLTVFAIGNSLGDLVSNITIARMGFPRMALAACFGGPLLNILVGIGVSCLVVLMKPEYRAHGYKVEVSENIIVSGAASVLVLLFLFFTVRFNSWKIARWMGVTTIGIWTVATVVNIVLETTSK
jgi:sodium/potassium/calcium exchanger 6